MSIQNMLSGLPVVRITRSPVNKDPDNGDRVYYNININYIILVLIFIFFFIVIRLISISFPILGLLFLRSLQKERKMFSLRK